MKEAVQQPPASSAIGMANWYWKVVRRFASERLGIVNADGEMTRYRRS